MVSDMNEIEKIATSAFFIITGLIAYIGSAIFWAIFNTSGYTFSSRMGAPYGLMLYMGAIGLLLIAIGAVIGIMAYLSMKKRDASDGR